MSENRERSTLLEWTHFIERVLHHIGGRIEKAIPHYPPPGP